MTDENDESRRRFYEDNLMLAGRLAKYYEAVVKLEEDLTKDMDPFLDRVFRVRCNSQSSEWLGYWRAQKAQLLVLLEKLEKKEKKGKKEKDDGPA